MGNVYGYARVSTKEQNLDRQIIALKQEGVPESNIFFEKKSGKDFESDTWRGASQLFQRNRCDPQ